jgi:hypothetical protein
MKTLKYLNNILSQVNNSPIIAAFAMLFLNISSRYIDIGLSKTQENAIKKIIARELLIFTILFVATKNILLSTTLTLIFFIFTQYIFNEKSKFCVAPNFFKKITEEADFDNDGVISDYEIEKAIEIIQRVRKQNKKNPQMFNNDEYLDD